MRTVAISVPSGSHHRSFLQPMRDVFQRETDWKFLVVTPGATWANRLFPEADYPRDRFQFVENSAAETVVRATKPSLFLTTTTGLDPKDVPLLERAQKLAIRTVTFVESWDNVWKMERVAKGLGKPRQTIVLPDHLMVWNEIMRRHALRAFPGLRADQVSVTGCPRLDYFGPRYASQLPSRADTLRSLGLRPEGKLLHLATTELYDHGHVAKAIANAKRGGALPPDLQLYASVHPGGNLARHRPWAERYGFTIRYSPGRREDAPHPDFRYNPTRADMLRLAAIFKETDIMVNLSSTVALESCLADRPTICAFFGKPFDWRSPALNLVEGWHWRRSMVVRDFREHYADLLRGGGIAVERNPRQLIEGIRAYLENPAKDRDGRRRSAELIATTLAGDASEHVLTELKRIISS